MKTETDGEDCGGPGPGGSRAKWQSGDLRLLKVKQEEVPHLCSSGLDQQNPELLIIKKEEEELWSSQEGEQLPVRSEDDEKPQLFQLHQIKTKNNRETETPTSSSAELMKTETDGEDCGGPEPDKNRSPNTNLQPITDERASDSSETEDSDDFDKDENMSGSGSDNEDSDEDWRETRTPGSEPPASCSAEQMKTKTDGEDCVGPEPGPGRSQANWQSGDLRLLKVQVVLRRLSYSLDQQNPELVHIKKLQQGLQCNEEGEQLPVEREDDEKPQLFQLHQIKTKNNRETETPTSSSAELMKTETDGEDCGGPEPDRNRSPNTNLQPNTDERASDSSETEDSNDYDEDENMSGSGSDDEDSDEDWRETRTPGSEPPASCSAEQMKTKTDGKACRDPEPDRTHDSNTDENTSDILSSEDDDDDDDDYDDVMMMVVMMMMMMM
ncbi:transcription initiation factor TFIID subunit 11, partial [Austrofundulus limnaeus]|uniref:Transcription initiation factor TFIID subunit 11 n=1 Tax=Austrofundulus limnaeus TaxID=52670 RepID=A0A2I4D7U9_AUSLI